MFEVSRMRTVAVGAAPRGHILSYTHEGTSYWGLRVGPDNTQTLVGLFRKFMNAPTAVPMAAEMGDASCIDLGPALVVIDDYAGLDLTNARVDPGHLIVHDKGLAIVASNDTNSKKEAWVVDTGEQVTWSTNVPKIDKWSVGVRDLEGEYFPLATFPPKAPL